MIDDFQHYLHAGYPLIMVRTHEEDRAIEALTANAQGYRVFRWDVIDGLWDCRTNKAVKHIPVSNVEIGPLNNPVAPLRLICDFPTKTIFFLKDFHRYINSIEVYQTLKNVMPLVEVSKKHIVLVSPTMDVPIELEKDITMIDFPLPATADITRSAKALVKMVGLDLDVTEQMIASALGLTRHEAENAIARSLVMHREIRKDVLEKEKLEVIKKSGFIEIWDAISGEEVGGLLSLKEYINLRKIAFQDPDFVHPPKGILMFGVPGCGKSTAAKMIAHLFGLPLARLDMNAIKGSLYGQSEKNMRKALRIIEAIQPCVVWIDEIEKAVGGVESSNKTDGGTTAAVFGAFLTWFQESKAKVYVAATSNDIDVLFRISQGALIRRFDDVFFIDLPTTAEKSEILAIMNRRYNTDVSMETVSRMPGWSGSEIEKFVASSRYEGVEAVLNNLKPLSLQNKERVKKMREWAKHNARLANTVEEESEETLDQPESRFNRLQAP